MAATPPAERRQRVWLDGCFDMFHWGHANVIRQSRLAVGGDPIIVVGVHDDEEIMRVKGPCLMHQNERFAAVDYCKYVDEMIPHVPYSPNVELMKTHKIDVVVHGDDIAVDANGHNAYEEIIKAGVKFQVVPRTEGVSTTDVIQRILDTSNKEHHFGKNQFLLSSRRIAEFAAGSHRPKPDDVIVYVDGAFDLLHHGHMELFRKAKELGTYLVVGVHEDKIVNEFKGKNFPILSLHERVLGVLACKFVDDVIIGAPWEISEDMIKTMNIKHVVHGKQQVVTTHGVVDPYKTAKRLGVYHEIDSSVSLVAEEIMQRVIENDRQFNERNAKKKQ
eukprot:TRINITY_DN6720_c0_g1_i1.p1 TRINITY_DN6720_c0_g1~~TRINITY_DN6720_c0_g1_i1.p1  ORF type:complete len:340 (+),score=113.42 TRINITY_DN6720_c0_g1_i1:27-1022(+)